MSKKKEEKEFDYSAVIDGVSDYIKELFEKVPDKYKASLAGYIAVEATVWGSYNTYEGVGILEVSKTEFLRACEENEYEDDDECDGDCENCDRNNENKIGIN